MNTQSRNPKGQFQKGLIPWNKNKFGIKTCESCGCVFRPKPGKLSIARFCGRSCSKKGSQNPSWVGDKVSYSALHVWINRHGNKGSTCEFCGSDNWLEWSNISGEYKRELDDFQTLCAKCHRNFDLERRHHAS
jgi:hypothetical protein